MEGWPIAKINKLLKELEIAESSNMRYEKIITSFAEQLEKLGFIIEINTDENYTLIPPVEAKYTQEQNVRIAESMAKMALGYGLAGAESIIRQKEALKDGKGFTVFNFPNKEE